MHIHDSKLISLLKKTDSFLHMSSVLDEHCGVQTFDVAISFDLFGENSAGTYGVNYKWSKASKTKARFYLEFAKDIDKEFVAR